MADTPSSVETLTGIVVLVAVGAQTWIVVQDATQGDAGRWVKRYWSAHLRPAIVKVIMWLDAKALIERMVTDEVAPILEGNCE
ncbi:MAG: hypothetical protein ACREMY_06540 [bacterium]